MNSQKLVFDTEEFTNQIPDKVIRNALWDITVLLNNTKNAKECFSQIAQNPNEFETHSIYFKNTLGTLRLFDLLIDSKDVPEEVKEKLTNMRLLWNVLDKTASPILDDGTKDKELARKTMLIFNTIIMNLDSVWESILKSYNVIDQLKSFKDRDMTEYVKNIIGYKPGNFSNAPDEVVEEFKDLFVAKYIAN